MQSDESPTAPSGDRSGACRALSQGRVRQDHRLQCHASGMVLRGYRTLLGEFEDNTRLFHQTTGYSQLGGEQPPLDSQTMYGLIRQPDYGLPPVGDIDVARQFSRVPHLAKEFVSQLSVQRGWTQAQAMDLLPGSESLADLETQFAAEIADAQAHGKPLPTVYTRLAQGMRLVQPRYDVVVLDTM